MKTVTIKGGIVWGWTIRRGKDTFQIVEETEIFFKVIPNKEITLDYHYYDKYLNENNTFLQVPKCYCIFT